NDKTRYPRGVLTILDPLLSLKNPEFDPFIGGLFGYDLVGEFYEVPVPEKNRERDLCLYFAEEMIVLDHKAQMATYEHLYLDAMMASRMDAYRSFNQQAEAYQVLVHRLNRETETSLPTISPELSTSAVTDQETVGIDKLSLSHRQASPQSYQQSYPQLEIQAPIVSDQNGVN